MTARSGSAPKVQLVNCSDDEREMYADYLHFRRMTTTEACQQGEALTLAERVEPDVVVVELIPGREADGLELIRGIRGAKSIQRAAIIGVTGRAFSDGHERALDAGCDVFLLKPLLPDVLLHEIAVRWRSGGGQSSRVRRRRRIGDP